LRASSTAEKARLAGSSWVLDFFAITLYNSRVGCCDKGGIGVVMDWVPFRVSRPFG
jgi:hypothetical protein